jgi:hypothetical protein
MNTIFEYKFSDGTIFKLLTFGFLDIELSLLSELHGKVISIRSYDLVC